MSQKLSYLIGMVPKEQCIFPFLNCRIKRAKAQKTNKGSSRREREGQSTRNLEKQKPERSIDLVTLRGQSISHGSMKLL